MVLTPWAGIGYVEVIPADFWCEARSWFAGYGVAEGRYGPLQLPFLIPEFRRQRIVCVGLWR
jgi:hypothetical protein